MSNERKREEIRLNLSSSEWLQGTWSYTEPRPDFALVYVHGFGSHRGGEKSEALEAACARRGWTFAAFDFRGHGQSSGTMRDLRGSGLLADLEAIQRFLAEQGATRLGLVGNSMGGWASAWFAARHPDRIPACIFIAPGFHFLTARWDRLTEPEREAWRRTGVLRIHNDWVDTEIGYGLVAEADSFPQDQLWRAYRTPGLIFQGLNDDIVSHLRTLTYLEKSVYPHLELRLYKDGDHRLNDRKAEIAEAACEFIARWLPITADP
jgi:pimeloyl-ACP methyl ester carboxylesterase